MKEAFSICCITHDSAAMLPGFFEALTALNPPPLELVIVDNASDDCSLRMAHEAEFSLPVHVESLRSNLGFSGGMNIAISLASGSIVLSLNPDTRPVSDFLSVLQTNFGAVGDGRKIGALTGRLVRNTSPASVVDAAGMRLAPTWRHLDRGSDELDSGQFSSAEFVFGGTGAATAYRKDALEDVKIGEECFLTEFHSYREDAELAFRLNERGWRTVYCPGAKCVHFRLNTPSRRAKMSPFVNFHSLKNRYLLRAYHENWATLLVTGLPTLVRDLGILVWVLVRERSSLKAFSWLWRNRKSILKRRRAIQARRTESTYQIARWFWQHSRSVD